MKAADPLFSSPSSLCSSSLLPHTPFISPHPTPPPSPLHRAPHAHSRQGRTSDFIISVLAPAVDTISFRNKTTVSLGRGWPLPHPHTDLGPPGRERILERRGAWEGSSGRRTSGRAGGGGAGNRGWGGGVRAPPAGGGLQAQGPGGGEMGRRRGRGRGRGGWGGWVGAARISLSKQHRLCGALMFRKPIPDFFLWSLPSPK